jgi:hypothetical protein
MPTPDPHGSGSYSHGHGSAPKDSPGYEVTDANVPEVVIFLIALAVSAAVIMVISYGIGKVINTAIAKQDGPLNKWNAASSGQITQKNLASDAQLEQEQLHQMTQNFPTPRLQIDDGDQDITDLHAREDLLLDHYSWVDQQHGKVRIPIGRAMELIAQHGLPVVPPAPPSESLMAGDTEPIVTAPLTNGFARTGFEQEALATMQQQRARGEAPGETAALGASR